MLMEFDSFERALKKAEDPNMTTRDNPLAEGVDPLHDIRHSNMERLERDACMRRQPHNGRVYAGIMNTRLDRR